MRDVPADARIGPYLGTWCEQLHPRRLVPFLGEADGLRPEPLLPLLSPLRAGYPDPWAREVERDGKRMHPLGG